MARYQIKKDLLNVDMTALCDVGFLLLCFLVFAGRPKRDYENRVQTPSIISYPICQLREGTTLGIIIGNGKCYLDMDRDTRKAVLTIIGQKHGISFTDTEIEKFAKMGSFGLPINQLKDHINNYQTNSAYNENNPGIPFDSNTDDQLTDWILAFQQANHELNYSSFTIDIIGDKNESYTNIQRVISLLQKRGINRFSLINSAIPLTASL